MLETIRNAQPSDVGGILRRMVGAREADERMKRMKFRDARRRFRKEQGVLILEEPIWIGNSETDIGML